MSPREFIHFLSHIEKWDALRIARYCGIGIFETGQILTNPQYRIPSISERKIIRKEMEYTNGIKGSYKEGRDKSFDRQMKQGTKYPKL